MNITARDLEDFGRRLGDVALWSQGPRSLEWLATSPSETEQTQHIAKYILQGYRERIMNTTIRYCRFCGTVFVYPIPAHKPGPVETTIDVRAALAGPLAEGCCNSPICRLELEATS